MINISLTAKTWGQLCAVSFASCKEKLTTCRRRQRRIPEHQRVTRTDETIATQNASSQAADIRHSVSFGWSPTADHCILAYSSTRLLVLDHLQPEPGLVELTGGVVVDEMEEPARKANADDVTQQEAAVVIPPSQSVASVLATNLRIITCINGAAVGIPWAPHIKCGLRVAERSPIFVCVVREDTLERVDLAGTSGGGTTLPRKRPPTAGHRLYTPAAPSMTNRSSSMSVSKSSVAASGPRRQSTGGQVLRSLSGESSWPST